MMSGKAAKLSGESEFSAADALRVSAIRGSRHVWSGKLNRPPLPSDVRAGCEISGEGGTSANRIPDVRYSEKVKRWTDRIPDMRYPEKVERRRTEFRIWDIRRRWNVGRTEFRMWDIRRRWNVGEQNSECEIPEEGGMSADKIPNVRYPDEVECRRTEFRMWAIRRRWNVGRTEFRMWDMRRWWNVNGQNSECEIPGGGGMSADRILDVRYPEEAERQRTEFRMWDIRIRWNVDRTEFFSFQEFQKLLPNGDRIPQKKGN